VNDNNYTPGLPERLTLDWKGDDIAVLRLPKADSWKPLLALGIFVVFWYGALLTTVDFSQSASIWQALQRTLREEPFLILFFLLPLFPLFMVTRDTFFDNRFVFDKQKQTISKGRRVILRFEEVDALVVRVGRTKTASRPGAGLSLEARSKRMIFLTRCDSYEACAALAQEIAVVVNAQIRNA
jgi:hypothetical protein